jgi:hypothetical protein
METGLAAHKRRVVAILALLALGALIFVAAGALWRRIDMVALLAPPPAPARPAYSAPIAPSPANPAAHPTALIETDIITNPTPTAAMTTPPPPAPTTTANVAVEPAPEQPTPPPPPPPAPQLTIVSAAPNPLPQREDADEIRLLKITLDNAEPPGAVDPRAVRLDVVFFDETEPGQFAPSAAARPIAPLIPEGAWEPGIPKTLNATYFVPRGARSAAGQTTGRFHGYVIRLFYRGILQDELAWPRNLLRASALKSEPADRAAR